MVEKLKSESDTSSLEELSVEIRETELKLKKLRSEYLSRMGVLPPLNIKDKSWQWTIYMTFGIAYITFITYFLGIKQSGRGEGFWIPDFLYNAEVQFYGVLSFFIIFVIVNIQDRRLRGYQALALLLGFWCAHWFLYDWMWWAMEFGFGHEDITFWASEFYSPLLIEKPPMWLFLTLAVFGVGMSIYTFTVPNNYKKLIPTVIWLYAVYMNGLVCAMIGFNTSIQLAIGLVLVALAFSLSIYNVAKKMRDIKAERRNTPNSIADESNPPLLKKYYLYIFIIMIVASYIFSVFIPVVGFIIGMVTWYIIPLIKFILNATPFQKLSNIEKNYCGDIKYWGYCVSCTILNVGNADFTLVIGL